MIVVARRVGFLGNNLILFAHFIAAARENNVTLLNPSFHNYAPYFRSTCDDLLCAYPCRSYPCQRWTALRRAAYESIYRTTRAMASLRCTNFPFTILRLPIGQDYDLGSEQFAELTQRNKLVIALGWGFRDHQRIGRHAEAIRAHFRPIETHERAVSNVIAAARQSIDVLIGVHFRQGDYQRFLGGKYFYSTEQYRGTMQRLVEEFSPRKVGFLVCSNVPQQASKLSGLRVAFGTGHLLEDMYSFAQCDYLIGPPSTFTGWASFYGNVPYFPLETHDAVVRSDSFTTKFAA